MVDGLIINGIKDDGSGNRDQTPDISEGIVDGAGWKMEWADGNKVVSINYVPGEDVPGEDVPGEDIPSDDTPSTDPVVPVEGVYTVAGSEALCGAEWNPEDASNNMVLGEDGIHTKTYSGLNEGSYEFKVVKDHSWDTCWPSTNYILNIPSDGCSATIKFNSADTTISVEIYDADGNLLGGDNNGGNTGSYSTYTVAGMFGLCGIDWSPSTVQNDMVYNAETGLYEKTFTCIPAGDYACKVVADHDWDVNCWGGEEGSTDDYGNYIINTFEKHDITITFDPTTGKVGHVLSDPTEPSEPIGPAVDFENCGTITIYVLDNAMWDTVFAHLWVEGGNNDIPWGNWPGHEMEWDGELYLYCLEIPAVCDSVVFNNNNGIQTGDLTIPGDKAVYDNGTGMWTDLNNYVPPIPPEDTTEDVTVTVKNGKGWNEVYIYFWDASGLPASDWPGVLMTQQDDGTWTYTIPAGFYSVIFNNGGSWEDGSLQQTPDLVIPTNGKTYIDISDSVLYNEGVADDNTAWKNLPSSGDSGNQGGNNSGNQGGNDSGNQGGNDSGNQGGNSGTEEPKQELTWLQELALQLLLFLRSIEDFFKGLFGG